MLAITEDWSSFYNGAKENLAKIRDHIARNKEYYMLGGGLLAGAAGLSHWLGSGGQITGSTGVPPVETPVELSTPGAVHGDPTLIAKQTELSK